MEKEIRLKLPCGYQTREKMRTTDLYKACELLKSKRQHHLTKAERNGDKVTLYWHTLRCPHCGKETPSFTLHCVPSWIIS